MAERAATLWRYRLLFIALSGALVFVQLLPLDLGPGQFPGPDVLMLLVFSWIVVRPDILPMTLIAATLFMADILFMRPLGLWTLLVVLGAEFLRSRTPMLREQSFLVEWLLVGGVVAAVFVANALILAIVAATQPGFGLTLIGLIATILVYPLVVILAGRAFGLRKPGQGDPDSLGQRA